MKRVSLLISAVCLLCAFTYGYKNNPQTGKPDLVTTGVSPSDISGFNIYTGIRPVNKGGTGTNNGSITGTGTLTFQAGGSNQGVVLKPSGTGYINLGNNTISGNGSIGVGVNTISSNHSVTIGVDNTVTSASSSDLVLGNNNTLSASGGINTVIGASNITGSMSISSVLLGASNNDNGSNNTLLGNNNTTTGSSFSLLAGLLVSASGTSTFGSVTLGMGDANVSGNPLVNSLDGSLQMGMGSTKPTMVLTVADQTGNPVTGTGRVLVAGPVDDGTSKLQVNGAVKGSSFNGITALASATSPMDGVAAVGTSTTVARQDHVHPVDTSRAAVAQTMFIGTTSHAINRASASEALTGITSIDGSAAKLTTGRTIGITGPITWTSPTFDGSGNVTAASSVASQTGTGSKFVMDTSPTIMGAVLTFQPSSQGVTDTTAYITNRVNSNASGYGAFTQYTDNITYNLGVGTDTDGSFAVYAGRYPSAAGTIRFRVTQAGVTTINNGGNVVYRCTGATNLGMLTVNSALCVTGFVTTSLKLD